MKWTFKDIGADLKNLNPKVRKKALLIAEDLIKEKGYSEEKAIKEAIKQAEEWFLDRQA